MRRSHSPSARVLDPPTGSRMWTSPVIGALFLAGFLIYGTGSILVNSVLEGPDFFAGVGSAQTTLALGAFLMIATSAVDIGKAVFFFPVLERHGKRTAVAYLATMVFEMTMMTVGVLALLMVIPLAEQAADGGLDSATAQALGSLAVDGNELAYQVGQLSLAFGALFLVTLLFRTSLVPRWLAVIGPGRLRDPPGRRRSRNLRCPDQPRAAQPRRHLRADTRRVASLEGVRAGRLQRTRSAPGDHRLPGHHRLPGDRTRPRMTSDGDDRGVDGWQDRPDHRCHRRDRRGPSPWGWPGEGANVAITGRDTTLRRTDRAGDPLGDRGRGGRCSLPTSPCKQTFVGVAGEALGRLPRLDVLVNNVGGYWNTRHVTVDGLERTFAVNHLAPFLLTDLLLARLREAGHAPSGPPSPPTPTPKAASTSMTSRASGFLLRSTRLQPVQAGERPVQPTNSPQRLQGQHSHRQCRASRGREHLVRR